jgi:hypothetical protein
MLMKRRTNGVLYGVAPDDHDGPDPDHASERAKGYAATAALRRLIYSGQALNLIEVPCSCAPGTLNTRQAVPWTPPAVPIHLVPGVRGTPGGGDGEEKKMAPWAPRLMLMSPRGNPAQVWLLK